MHESELWCLSVLYNTTDGRLSSKLEWLLLALSDSLRTRSISTILHCPLNCFFHPKGCKRNQLDPLWALVDSSSLGLYFPSSFRGQFHQSIRVIISLPKIQRGTQAWMPGSSPISPPTLLPIPCFTVEATCGTILSARPITFYVWHPPHGTGVGRGEHL